MFCYYCKSKETVVKLSEGALWLRIFIYTKSF